MRERTTVGTVDDLLASATRITGLEDFGDDEFREPLELLVDALTTEAGLTGAGNAWQRAQVRGALVARLVAQAGFASHPDHADVPITAPIVVTGIRRSGTTMLQRLLAADPGAQGLEMWLTQVPQPRPARETWDADPVFAGLKEGFDAHHAGNPELAGVHYTHADTLEECWQLLRQSLITAAFPALAHVPSYTAWLQGGKADRVAAYRRHRQNLQLIGLHEPAKRWVLKNPSHLGALDAILEVYPDALVVQTHRDPVVAVGSSCSLAEVSTRGLSDTYTGPQLGADVVDQLAWEVEAFADARARHPEGRVLDVEYADLVADPVGTTAAVYDHFGLDWSSEAESAVRAEDAASRTGIRAPRHHYDLADFGLSPEQVRERFTHGG